MPSPRAGTLQCRIQPDVRADSHRFIRRYLLLALHRWIRQFTFPPVWAAASKQPNGAQMCALPGVGLATLVDVETVELTQRLPKALQVNDFATPGRKKSMNARRRRKPRLCMGYCARGRKIQSASQQQVQVYPTCTRACHLTCQPRSQGQPHSRSIISTPPLAGAPAFFCTDDILTIAPMLYCLMQLGMNREV